MTFMEKKKKERPKLIHFEEGRPITDKIHSRSRQKKNAQPDARTLPATAVFNITQHSS